MRPKYTTLYFRSITRLYDPYPVTEIQDNNNIDNYYTVVTYPSAEMTTGGKSPTAVAEDYVSLTMSSRWHWTLRRTVSAGDVFALPPHYYMFIRSSEMDAFQNRFTTHLLPMWNHLAIIQLQPKEKHARIELRQCDVPLYDERG